MKATNEDTIIEQNGGMINEETVVESQNPSTEEIMPSPQTPKNKLWKDAGIGAGTGVAAGIIATLFTSGSIASAEESDSEESGGVAADGLSTPIVTDGELAIAHSVNDNMSFNEAFSAAHDEVGPGGVFEWHGQLYNTYTAEEWNGLSSAERQEFSNHLRVVGTPDYASNVSHQESPEQPAEPSLVDDVPFGETETSNEASQNVANNQHGTGEVTDVAVDTAAQTGETEVEVLGVEYMHSDDGQEIAIGGMSVDGQDIFVVDADNDGIGDVAAFDMNGNGQIDEDELLDISDNPIEMPTFETSGSDVCGGVDTAEPDYLAPEVI